MEKYREMLKQALLNRASCNEIAKSRGISHNTVRRAKRLAEAAGLTETDITELSDTQLREILYPKKRNTNYVYPDLEFELTYLEKGYNLLEAHSRYVAEVGLSAAIKYSAYCRRIRKYRKNLATEFRYIHQPGYAMQIDFAGYRPKGRENGSDTKFELFVATFPASHYIYAVVVRSQSTLDTIEASIQSLEFFKGVPETIVSDNLKAVVISRPRRASPVINQRYLAFADHYGTRVAPARVRRPKDKASVEVAVKLIQRLLSLHLKSHPTMEINEINTVLKQLVDDLNSRPMKRGGETRRERFERLDQPELFPLPKERLTFIGHPRELVVPPNYHVRFEGAHYSVPYHLVSKRVSIRHSPKKIEIRFDGQPIAIHERSYTADKFVTIASHMPANHAAVANFDFNDWRAHLSPEVQNLVDSDLKISRHGKQRVMNRVRQLIRNYGAERFERACKQALENEHPRLGHVTNLLSNKLEEIRIEHLKPNTLFRPTKNVRGPDYFGQDFNDGENSK